jgi:hypothetical protein
MHACAHFNTLNQEDRKVAAALLPHTATSLTAARMRQPSWMRPPIQTGLDD